MTLYIGLVLLTGSCLARSSSGCAATLSDLLSLCRSGQYLDTRACTCRNCTYTCPPNQIVRRLCSPVSDSICGPFFEFRQRKKPKKQWEATTEEKAEGAAGPGIDGRGQVVHSVDGIRDGGVIPLFSVNYRATTVKLCADQLKDCDDGMKVHSSRWYLGLLISAAAAALLMLVAAVSTIIIIASRKKTQLRNIVASSADYRRMMVSPDEGNSSANRSVVHIESQLVWNSQRRGGGVASLLGRKYSGNDYVRESDQKTALSSTFDAADQYYN